MVEARCILCGMEVQDCTGLEACPNCNSKSRPLDPKDDVSVNINWHELRVLAMWSERWAIGAVEKDPSSMSGRGLIYAIVERLQKQHPELSPLTLAGEIGKLREDGFDIQTTIPGM